MSAISANLQRNFVPRFDMNTFLVKVEVSVRRYMSGHHKDTETKFHIVRAKDSYAAEEKLCKYYKDKSDPYHETYYIEIKDTTEEIV